MRAAVLPQPPARLDVEATYEALRRLGGTVEDVRTRTDVLEGVSAYANTSMSKNAFIQGEKWLPFSSPVGESKGVQLIPWNNGAGYRLLSEGLWRVDVAVAVWDTIYTGDDWNDLDIVVFRPDGVEDHRKRFMIRAANTSRVTLTGCHSFTTLAPGYTIACLGRTGRWRHYQGGTLWSTFSINKWDNRTPAMPPAEVPDDPEPKTALTT